MVVWREPFEIEADSDSDGAVRFRLHGELDLATVQVLTRRLQERSAPGQHLRLDLSGLEFIDSSGIRALLEAAEEARRDGWVLEIVPRLMPQVARVMKLVGVDSLLWPSENGG